MSAVISLEFIVVVAMALEIAFPAVIVADFIKGKTHLGILHMVLKLGKCIFMQV